MTRISYPSNWNSADVLDLEDSFECQICTGIMNTSYLAIHPDGSYLCEDCYELHSEDSEKDETGG